MYYLKYFYLCKKIKNKLFIKNLLFNFLKKKKKKTPFKN